MLKKPFYMFLGYRTDVSSLKDKEHLGLLEKFELDENGSVIRKFARTGLDFDANRKPELEEYAEKGLIDKEVWVTPGLPFHALNYGRLYNSSDFRGFNLLCRRDHS